MGIDLKVMASSFREHGGELLPTATLRFDRDSGLFAQLTLEALPCLVRQMPKGLKVGCYEDNGLNFTDVDRSNRPLTYTTPAEVRRLKVPDDIHPGTTRYSPFFWHCRQTPGSSCTGAKWIRSQ